MKCFTHQAKDAVGTCKACSKGICAECAADLGHSISCKSTLCEEKANLMDAGLKRSSIALNAIKISPSFPAIMGIIFIYFGYPGDNFLLATGSAFLAIAGAHYFLLRKQAPDIKKVH